MGRAVRQFELIACKKRRLQVWNRRMKSLKKMASILSQKCGIEVAMIYSGPEGNVGSSETISSWPDDARECRLIIEKFRGKDVKAREKNEDCLLDILKERKRKLEKLLREVVADREATLSPVQSEPGNVVMPGGDGGFRGVLDGFCRLGGGLDCNAAEVFVVDNDGFDGIFDGLSPLDCNSEILLMNDEFEGI